MLNSRFGWLGCVFLIACGESAGTGDGGINTSQDGGMIVSDAGMDGGAEPFDAGSEPDTDAGTVDMDGGMLPLILGATGCQPMTLEADINLSNYRVDRYGWFDSDCRKRTAALVRNSSTDPGGSKGGYLRELTWSSATKSITSKGTNSSGWNGWGYVVNHYAGSAALSQNVAGTFRTILSGTHHSVHEFKLQMSMGGPVGITVWWSFSTGRSAPVYAITFDVTAAVNAVTADTRAPYGTLAFEGTPGEIGGIGWGDKYRFTTTGSGPLTWNSPWDYTAPNTVPYVRMWSNQIDAEMGSVQTESFNQHIAGGDYGTGILEDSCWNKTSATKGPDCSDPGNSLPKDWLWPFQLNQYELEFTNSSHRIAWGSSYGAIGNSSVTAFGKTFSGYPKVSYAVFMVVGERTKEATFEQVTNVEHSVGAEVTAPLGFVPSWNPLFASWDLEAISSAATLNVNPKAGPVRAPMFRFLKFTASKVSQVTLNGHLLTANVHYFVTVDPKQPVAWLTLNGSIAEPVSIHIE